MGVACLQSDDSYRDAFEQALEWHDRGAVVASTGHAHSLPTVSASVATDIVPTRGVLLRAAVESFYEVGSAPWAERARRELRATGETTHPRVSSSRDRLTPQELQVARLAAEGLSNNEIATRLFISPRTVEKHLGQTFRKLDVSSRRGLILAGAMLLQD